MAAHQSLTTTARVNWRFASIAELENAQTVWRDAVSFRFGAF